MGNLFRFPIRVYIVFGVLALFGFVAGKSLSVSLFPTSGRPTIAVRMYYRNLTADDFVRTYGRDLEARLQSITFDGHDIEKVEADYNRNSVRYQVHFHWGTPARQAEKETRATVQGFAAVLPLDIRESIDVYTPENAVGFFALNYFSQERSLDDLYNYLEPILTPRLSQIEDAQFVDLWNPSSKEVQINLNPERMAELGLLPRNLIDTLSATFHNDSGGYVQIGTDKLEVVMRRQVDKPEDLENVLIPTANGHSILLKEIATIAVTEPKDRQRIIRTSGQKSLMIYAQPRPGGNIKKMSEDILKVVNEVQATLPKDIQARPLVDPSVFIRSAVENVLYEVALAAFLAVLILFAFIGNMKNVATAAIEIPISIILSFILMKWAGINLNLISLAGLALSAGMNVDGSVVVMENIFRHFEKRKHDILSWSDRVQIVTDSVKEVRLPLVATTIASLVVFLPLGFTSALTNALLGDLAWAVVFSHGVSAFVALILVPTIRLHLLRKGTPLEKPAPLEGVLHCIENRYAKMLHYFLISPRVQMGVLLGALATLVLAVTFILPRLPREIIGKPDTDWVELYLNNSHFTNIHQMDGLMAESEVKINEVFGPKMLYTFSQAYSPSGGYIMFRLKDKRQMDSVIEEAEKTFVNSPDIRYSVSSFNPSELPIPNPPQLRVEVRSAEAHRIQVASDSLWDMLMENDKYSRISGSFSPGRQEAVMLQPNWEQLALLENHGASLRAWDIADISRLATSGAKVGDIHSRHDFIPVWLRYPEERVRTLSDLESLPIGLQGRILPLKALATPLIEKSTPGIYHENERELSLITGYVRHEDLLKSESIFQETSKMIEKWKVDHANDGVTVQYTDGQEELNEALDQLKWAVALSILLIFVTMVLQFGDVASAVLVLIPIPLGFIGVVISLWVFHSTLSLNSALGTILLNGIVVGNSIILVDFFRREITRGLGPLEAALSSSRIRLRPILMTSLTTGLGMIPIAFGIGEGGKILQPLGLAVVGGLTCSFLLTLFLVPLFQTWYWTWRQSRVSPTSGTGAQDSAKTSGSSAHDILTGFLFVFILTTFGPKSMAVAEPITDSPSVGAQSSNQFHRWLHDHVLDYPTVRQRKETWDGSKARQLSARLRFLPSVTLNGQRNVVLDPYNESQTYGGDAYLNIFRFGADAAEVNRQNAANDLDHASYDQAKMSAESDVADLYFLDLDTKLRRNVLKEMDQQDETLRKIGLERYQKGLLPLEEREKLEIDVLNRHAQYETLEQRARDIEARRSTLIITESLSEWPWLNSDFEKYFEGIANRELALEAHPDWRADDSAWRKAQAERDQAWAGIYPSLDAHAAYASGETLTSSFLTGTGPTWTNSVVLTVPIFSGYTSIANYQESIAVKSNAEIARDHTRHRLMEDWKARVAQFHQWIASLKSRRHAFEAATRINESSLRRFRGGHESVNDLSVDQERSRHAELLLLDAEIEYHRSALRMMEAAGEIWSE